MSEQLKTSETADEMSVRVASLHSAFCRIQTQRMQDVPILNPALTVATVGFQRWEAYWLGVLITPWMMKLIGLPVQMQHLAQAEVSWQFPFGQYTLLRDTQPEVGAYYSVSLFSPMHEFGEQVQAENTGIAVMQNLFEVPQAQSGETALAPEAEATSGITRRELLFGAFRGKKSG